ncbi:MAG: flagellar protein FlgN [Lachnospiraceae bacterium]|nr:flagellar protein FlgN [Lachnospiraceae bacterium]
MASIIDELISALEGELVLYDKLIPLAESKAVAIIENDLERLSEVTQDEQNLLDEITLFENKREKSVKNIKDVLNRREEDINLDKIIGFLEKQPEEQGRLKAVQKELRAVTDRLRHINLQNKSLIEESLDMIEFSMNLMQSTRMAPENNNYNKRASFSDASVSHTGMFDAKQ